MNHLPDMMVLGFCEWLKNKVYYEHYHQNMDALDLILNKEYQSRFQRYVEEYLYENTGYPIKSLLHQFINSMEFDEYLKCCHSHFFRNRTYRVNPNELRCFIHDFVHHDQFSKYFDKFILNYKENTGNDTCFDERISPSEFAYYIKSQIENCTEQSYACMDILRIDLSIEIDFLEWLIHTQNKPLKISQMPLDLFENLIIKYQKDCGKDDMVKQKLIQEFKQSDSNTFAQKLMLMLPHGKVALAKKAQSLGYIAERYSNSKIPYKCVILPLGTKEAAKEYQNLIKNYWYDLHYMSGDYLDIYYSEVDYGKSGYEVMKTLNYIPQHFKGSLPNIVLWQYDMSKAKSIGIGKLNSSDIFEVISKIVEQIQANAPFEKIVSEAEIISLNCRKEKSFFPIIGVRKNKAGRDLIVNVDTNKSSEQ